MSGLLRWVRRFPQFVPAVQPIVAILAVTLLTHLLSESLSISQIVPDDLALDEASEQINVLIELFFVGLTLVGVFTRRRKLVWISLAIASTLQTLGVIGSFLLLVTTVPDRARDAGGLITDALLLLAINVVVFAVWYWILEEHDLGSRSGETRAYDFLFPQRADPIRGWEAWRPNLIDYLFLSFTMCTAFSPTDTSVLSRRAKLLVAIQTAIALGTIAVMLARAINVLGD